MIWKKKNIYENLQMVVGSTIFSPKSKVVELGGERIVAYGTEIIE
jgi:hypothetical protein